MHFCFLFFRLYIYVSIPKTYVQNFLICCDSTGFDENFASFMCMHLLTSVQHICVF